VGRLADTSGKAWSRSFWIIDIIERRTGYMALAFD